jgi:hypothetical protein
MSLGWLQFRRLKRRSLKSRLLSRRKTLARNTSRRMKAFPTLFNYDPPKDIPFESLKFSRPNTPLSFRSRRSRKPTRGELFWNFFKFKQANFRATATVRTQSIGPGRNSRNKRTNRSHDGGNNKKTNTFTTLLTRTKKKKSKSFYEGIYSERNHFLNNLGNDIPRPLTPRRVHTAPTRLIGASLSGGPATPYSRYQFGNGFQPGEYSRFPAPPLPQHLASNRHLPMRKPVPLGRPDGVMSKHFDPSTPTGQLNINNLRKQQLQQQQQQQTQYPQQGNLPFFPDQPGFRDTRTPEIPARSLARRFSTPVVLGATISNLENQRYSLPNHAGEFAPISGSPQLESIYSNDGNTNNTSNANNVMKRHSSYTPSPLSASDASSLMGTSSPRLRSVSVSSTTTAGTFHEKMQRAPIRRKPVGSGPYRCKSFTASIAESLAESVKSDDAASEIFDLYSESGHDPTSPEPQLQSILAKRHNSQKSFTSYSSTDEASGNDEVNMANLHKSTENVNNVMLHNKPASGDLKVYFYEEPFQALSTDELLAEFSMMPRANPLLDADVDTKNLSVVAPAAENELQPTISDGSLTMTDACSFVTALSSPISPLDESYWSSHSSIYDDEDNDCQSIETVPALIPPSKSLCDYQNPRDSIASTISCDTTMESTSQCESNRTSIISRQIAYEGEVDIGKNNKNGTYMLVTADDVTARPHSAPLTRLLPDANPEGIDNVVGGGLLKRALSTATPRTFGANLFFVTGSGGGDANGGAAHADIVSVASANDPCRLDSPIPFMGPLSEFDYYD